MGHTIPPSAAGILVEPGYEKHARNSLLMVASCEFHILGVKLTALPCLHAYTVLLGPCRALLPLTALPP